MSDNQDVQSNALITLNQSYNKAPFTPVPTHLQHQSQYPHRNRSQADLLFELKQTQVQLSFARNELERIHARFDEAQAQAKHDRELITGMQDRITELEQDLDCGRAPTASGSRPREDSFEHIGGPPRVSQSGPNDGSPVEESPRFPDFEDKTTAQRAMKAAQGHQTSDILAPNTTGSQISPVGDLFSPFPSRVLGPAVPEPVKIEDPVFSAQDFGRKIAAIWELTEAYAKTYTNSPNEIEDHRIYGKLLDNMVCGFSKHAVIRMLGDSSTRFLVVAKVLNGIIGREILKPNIVWGFDRIADDEICRLKTSSYSNTPPVVKYAVFEASAKQFLRLRNMSLFDNFFNKRMYDNAKALLDILRPLVRHREQDAWTDMAHLMKEAHTLSLHMHSGPYEFKFKYAKMNDDFDPMTMTDRDAARNEAGNLNMLGPGQLVYRVKFAITPSMHFRDVTPQPKAPLTTICGAQVVLVELCPFGDLAQRDDQNQQNTQTEQTQPPRNSQAPYMGASQNGHRFPRT